MTVLPAAHRLTGSDDFRRATRAGSRGASRTLVVHLAGAVEAAPATPRVGFVVSRAVGTAVVRNLVKRRLRHLVRPLLGELPASSVLVVRALPSAGTASAAELRADLVRCLQRCREGARS